MAGKISARRRRVNRLAERRMQRRMRRCVSRNVPPHTNTTSPRRVTRVRIPSATYVEPPPAAQPDLPRSVRAGMAKGTAMTMSIAALAGAAAKDVGVYETLFPLLTEAVLALGPNEGQVLRLSRESDARKMIGVHLFKAFRLAQTDAEIAGVKSFTLADFIRREFPSCCP